MTQDEVVSKIKKLLALSKSTSAEEAAVALEKANYLITKYNLSLNELDRSNDNLPLSKYAMFGINTTGMDKLVLRYVRGILIDHFFVVPLSSKNLKEYNLSGDWTIVGKQHDVDVAVYVLWNLYNSYKYYLDSHSKKCGRILNNDEKVHFLASMSAGLTEKLFSQFSQADVSRIVQNSEAFFNHILSLAGLGTSIKSNTIQVCTNELSNKAFEIGKSIELSPALGRVSQKRIA